MAQHIQLIAHNLRSAHNVGSLLRTAEALGVEGVILSGYTPYPKLENDSRLPHIAKRVDAHIAKTALGAERLIPLRHSPKIEPVLEELRQQGYQICALEQDPRSVALDEFQTNANVALIVGREVEGIEPAILGRVDDIIEIPLKGSKESLNVVQAAAIALYKLSLS